MREAAEITAELIASGMDQRQTALVMELVLVLSCGNSVRTLVESPEQLRLEKRRAWDRERKRLKKLSANSTGIPLETTGIPPERVERACNLKREERGLPEEVLKKKESKKGTRISSDFALTDEDIQFALSMGIPLESVKDELAEFVDYWIAIPGSRGTKLNWHSTWRNRVRQIAPKYRNRNVQRSNSLRADSSAGRATAKEANLVASLGRGAIATLAKNASGRRDGQASEHDDVAGVYGFEQRAESTS